MYILLESSSSYIAKASVFDINCMGAVKTEKDAMDWRNENIEYRDYKYMSDKTIKTTA